MQIPAELFERAAAALLAAGGSHDAGTDRQVLSLLDALGYLPARAGEDASEALRLNRHRAALLQVAARSERLFQLFAPAAPGLVCSDDEAAYFVGVALARVRVDGLEHRARNGDVGATTHSASPT